MEPTESSPAVETAAEYQGVRFTATHAILLDDDREAVRIPTASLRSLELRHGLVNQHPVAAMVLAGLLLFLGWRAVIKVLSWLTAGGEIWDFEILLGLLIPLGFWLLRDALRRGPYLLADLKGKRRKLAFDGELDDDFSAFAARVAELTNAEIQGVPETDQKEI